jgi:hypothetical protein
VQRKRHVAPRFIPGIEAPVTAPGFARRPHRVFDPDVFRFEPIREAAQVDSAQNEDEGDKNHFFLRDVHDDEAPRRTEDDDTYLLTAATTATNRLTDLENRLGFTSPI